MTNNTNLSRCFSVKDRLNLYTQCLLEQHNVDIAFASNVEELTPETLIPETCVNRIDLRDIPCFTIDCDDTKDIDDAVSLEKTAAGYILGVHIADVAAYITPGSLLDDEAFSRGTSIYLPNQTIPMLPQILSNNLCSLNPCEDRLAVSVMISLDCKGNVLEYRINKTIIRSCLKGSYSEVNRLLSGHANAKISEKYAKVSSMLFDMKNLSEELRKARIQRGATISCDEEVKFVAQEWSLEIVRYIKGDAEHIVEEFMVLANNLVADYFLNKNLPVVYRAQAVKKTMATYTTVQCHHAELAIQHYAHFTSPIRRLADLKVHQVLTAHLNGLDIVSIRNEFDIALEKAAEMAKKRKIRADNITNIIRKYCIKIWVELQPEILYQVQFVKRNTSKRIIVEILPYHIHAFAAEGFEIRKGETRFCKLHTRLQDNSLTAVSVA